MDTAKRKIVGALLLLLGVSSLAVAIYTGQMSAVLGMLNQAFKTVTS